ncbi:para-nitrobenzyl esterase [Pyrenochaeta sp. MPI-SDFR-AT-0127]|nr:para-nitrobenzyl esterase [Pyrenochaeta sp. MPI-SDFR-AT-0127]
MTSTTLQTSFGTFTGDKSDGVTQYRGIKYANLENQLSVPEIVTHYGDETIDATKFGPRAPAMDGCALEQDMLIQCSIGVPKHPPNMSGTDCLNLNITIPDEKTSEPLPVMVFIHGGGFLMGSNYWPQYDPSRLVKLSASLEMPVIVVNINYRLSVLGNLTSEELRSAGYPGNNSLRDQKCAFQWIQANIAGFGGDAGNVTAFGESAGAVSVLSQLFSEESLFKRAISMSGTPIMLKPLPPPVTEMAYVSIMKELALENASLEERTQRLITISPDELVASTPMTVPLVPYLDGDLVSEATNFINISGIGSKTGAWCEELMIGDCQHDGNVFLFSALAERRAGIATALERSFSSNLSAAATDAILGAYSIDALKSDDEAMLSIISLATDIAYYIPAVSYARSFPGKTYYYNFNEPNPWDGAFKGFATHMLDAAYLFQNFKEHLSPESQDVGKRLAKDFISFANGRPPWQELTKEVGETRLYGSSSGVGVGSVEKFGWGNGRRDTLFRLSEEGVVDLNQLSIAWDLFMAGK